MIPLWTSDQEQYIAFTSTVAAAIDSVVQRRRAVLSSRSSAGSLAGLDALARYCEFSRWPSRMMEYAFVDSILREIVAMRSGSPLTVLDVGTGPSILPDLAVRRVGRGIVCADPDIPVVDAQRHLAPHTGLALAARWLVADGQRLPFADRAFPVVTCISVLEHLQWANRLALMAELLRVVQDDGVVVVTLDYRELSATDRCRKLGSRLWKALRLTVAGRPAAVVVAARAPKPFSWKELVSMLSDLGATPEHMPRHVTPLRAVRAFWDQAREPDFSYPPKRGRDYVPVGLILTKDSATARRVEAQLRVPCQVVTRSVGGAAQHGYGPRSSRGAEGREPGRGDPS